MASFMDYYQDELRKRQTAPVKKPAPVTNPAATLGSIGGAPKEDDGIFSPDNPIGWALDMLSRTTYGVQNVVRSKIDDTADAVGKISGVRREGNAITKTAPDPVGGTGDLIASVLGLTPNQLGAFGRGLTSNRKEDKITTADNIERLSDVANMANPAYVDEQDNVNPIAKGVAGFVGDVALDPLTYVPGALIATAGGKIGAAVKGAAQGAKAAVKPPAARVAEAAEVPATVPVAAQAAESAAPVVDNVFEGGTVRPAPEAPASRQAEEVAPEQTPIVPQTVEAPAPVSPEVPRVEIAAEKAVEAVAEKKTLAQVLKESPKVAGMRDEIKAIFDEVKTVEGKPNAEVTVEKWLTSPEGKKTVYVQLPGTGQQKNYSMTQLARIASVKDPAAAPQAQAAREIVMKTFDEYRNYRATAVTSAVQAFGDRMARGETALRATLGEDLVDLLSGISSDSTMNRTREMLDNILSGRVDVDAFAAQGKSQQDLLDILSRSLGEAPGASRLPSSPSPASAPAERVAELSATSEVLRQVARQEMLYGTPEFSAKYPELVKGNPVAFTSKEIDARLGRWWRKANSFFQYTLFSKLWDDVLKERVVEQTARNLDGYVGKPRAAAVRDAIESTGDDITRAMETFGIPLHIGVDDRLVKLTFPQVYKGLDEALTAQFGDDAALLALYNGGTSVAFTRLLEAVHASVTDAALSVDEIAAIIRNPSKQGVRGGVQGGRLPNNIRASYKGGTGPGTGVGKGWYSPSKTVSPRMQALAEATGGKWVKGQKAGYQLAFEKGGNLPEMLAQAIVGARGTLADLAEQNAADWAARGIAEGQEITGKVITNLRRLAEDPSKAAQRELANAIKAMPKDVAEEAAAMAATPEGALSAAVSTRAAVGERAVKDAQALDKQARQIDEGVDITEAGKEAMISRVTTAQDDGMKALLDETHEFPEPAPAVEPDRISKVDIGELADMEVQSAINGTLRQRAGKAFSRHHDIDPALRDVQVAAGTRVGEMVTRDVIRPVKALFRAHDPATLGNALKALQQGTRLEPGTELATAAAGIDRVISTMLDTSGPGSPLGNVFLDSGADLERINGVLRWAFADRVAPQFDLDAASTAAKNALGPKASKAKLKARTARELKEQWRTWDLSSDASASLVALGQASARVVEHEAIAASFVKIGEKNGFVVRVPKGDTVPAGFVKPVDGRGTTNLLTLFPKGTYVAKEIVPTLARMEYLTTASRQISGEVGDLVRGSILPATNTWKQGMTIYRPGHHIRNVVGNMSLQYVNRGARDFRKAQQAAFKIMGRRNEYEGIDFLQMLKSLGDDAVPGGGDVIVRGRYGEITTDTILDEMSKRGLFPTYEASEGLLTEDVKRGGLFERMLRPLDADNNPVGRLGAKVSEATDHHARVAHMVQILMQESAGRGRWKIGSLDALFDRAAQDVRKFHPDSSLLTPFENKYMKVIIPFYSWLRGVLPGALESALMNPGRISAFNKASYNAAIAAGVNPDSLGDPFPEDQLFPSFLREAAFGPQLKVGDTYIRVNPGIAHFDIAQSFGADPVRGVLGMTNPLFRVPAEVAAGGSWGTGGRINDTGEYVEQSIPGVNYLANLTGVSPTGSVESLLSGGGLDPQYQVERGNKTEWDKLITGINWLTGAGVQNLSRPNYINYAEIERRNEAGGR